MAFDFKKLGISLESIENVLDAFAKKTTTIKGKLEDTEGTLGSPKNKQTKNTMFGGFHIRSDRQTELATEGPFPIPEEGPTSSSLMKKVGNISKKKLDSGKIGELAGLAVTGARAAAGDPTAMVELASKALEHGYENIKGGIEEGGKALKSTRIGETAGHGIRAIGKFATAADPTGVSEIPYKFAAALVKSIDAFRDFNKGLHDANMQFDKFSGGMAAVSARQEVREIELSRERGDRRSGTAEYLAKSSMDLEKILTPMEDHLANIKNFVMGTLSQVLTAFIQSSPLLQVAMKLLEQASKIAEKLADENQANEADKFDEWLNEGAKRIASGRPERFR